MAGPFKMKGSPFHDLYAGSPLHKEKLSLLDKIKAASKAVSESRGPFHPSKFIDRYREAKKDARKIKSEGGSYNPKDEDHITR